MKSFLSWSVIFISTLLTGCASTFTSQVSVFHEWPGNQQARSYIVERSPSQENNPEYKLYEEELRKQLGLHGFQEVRVDATPALKIGMQYGTALSEIQVSTPWAPAMYDPFWQTHFSRGYRFWPYSPYYFGGPYYMGRNLDFSVRRYYLHQLEINISDFQNGKKLADIKVSSEQLGQQISEHMPYLIESALKDFPGTNGTTRTVELPLKK
ncbi:DUF4136 domain-containing protein [Undibacterium sp. WLX3042]|uniref:DUF4136 domain-containing protein n=1 Tax=Undibacterium sp. WLX3042 TaxID=3412686 RepID=UPI003C30E5E0